MVYYTWYLGETGYHITWYVHCCCSRSTPMDQSSFSCDSLPKNAPATFSLPHPLIPPTSLHLVPPSLPLMKVSLKLQKRLAASVLKCGKGKIWLDPNEVNEISLANSRQNIRKVQYMRSPSCFLTFGPRLRVCLHRASYREYSSFCVCLGT